MSSDWYASDSYTSTSSSSRSSSSSSSRVVDVPMQIHRWPGRGVRLERVWRENSLVERLEIPLDILDYFELHLDRFELEDLIAYIMHSTSLRSFRLRLPASSFIVSNVLARTSAFWLKVASRNKHIEELELYTEVHFPSQALHFISHMRLKRLRIPLCQDVDRQLFYYALQANPTLQHLELFIIQACSPQWAAELIRKLPCPPCLEAFTIRTALPIMGAVASFIGKAPSCLTEISLCHKFDKKGMKFLLGGLRSNQSISKLTCALAYALV